MSGHKVDTRRRFDRREAPRGDRLSGRGSINHGFLARRGRLLPHKGDPLVRGAHRPIASLSIILHVRDAVVVYD